MRVVLDSTVFAGAIAQRDRACIELLRACLNGQLKPLVSSPLFSEVIDLVRRQWPMEQMATSEALAEAYLSCCEWVDLRFLLEPDPKDDGNLHLINLVIEGGAEALITANTEDFAALDLPEPFVPISDQNDFLDHWNKTT